MAQAYGCSELVSPIRGTGAKIHRFDFAAGGLSEGAERFEGISENGRAVNMSAGDIGAAGIGGIVGPVDDLPDLTDEDIQALRAKYAVAQKKQEDDAAKAAAERQKTLERIKKEHPELETTEKSGKSSHALGAANIRRELKKTFPGVKFSVRSESYSGGDSINISWDYGPFAKDVEAITGKYQEGNFNGMEDIYEYNRSPWPEVFGGAKYVFESRNIPTPFGAGVNWFDDSFYGEVGRALCDRQGVEYKGEYTKNVFGEHDYELLSDHVRGIIYQTEFPAGAWKLAGFEKAEKTPFLKCKIEPEKEAKPAGEKKKPKAAKPAAEVETAAADTGGGVTISEHTHTKKGFQMWIVQLAGHVDRGQFMELLTKARAVGGWYSRAWKGTPGGFAFKDETKARTFAAGLEE